MRGSRIAVLGAALAVLFAGIAHSTPGAVTLTTDPRNPEVIVGRVLLGVPPDQVWSRVRQVDKWGQLFTDIRELQVRKRDGGRWIIRLDSAILKCGPHDYEIHFKGDRLAELRINAPGIDASGTLSVAADAGGSLFEYRLRIHVGRVAGWFVSERDVRDRQWRLVGSYLTDLEKTFGGARGAVHP